MDNLRNIGNNFYNYFHPETEKVEEKIETEESKRERLMREYLDSEKLKNEQFKKERKAVVDKAIAQVTNEAKTAIEHINSRIQSIEVQKNANIDEEREILKKEISNLYLCHQMNITNELNLGNRYFEEFNRLQKELVKNLPKWAKDDFEIARYVFSESCLCPFTLLEEFSLDIQHKVLNDKDLVLIMLSKVEEDFDYSKENLKNLILEKSIFKESSIFLSSVRTCHVLQNFLEIMDQNEKEAIIKDQYSLCELITYNPSYIKLIPNFYQPKVMKEWLLSTKITNPFEIISSYPKETELMRLIFRDKNKQSFFELFKNSRHDAKYEIEKPLKSCEMLEDFFNRDFLCELFILRSQKHPYMFNFINENRHQLGTIGVRNKDYLDDFLLETDKYQLSMHYLTLGDDLIKDFEYVKDCVGHNAKFVLGHTKETSVIDFYKNSEVQLNELVNINCGVLLYQYEGDLNGLLIRAKNLNEADFLKLVAEAESFDIILCEKFLNHRDPTTVYYKKVPKELRKLKIGRDIAKLEKNIFFKFY